MKQCEIIKIVGGPKLKFYCKTCDKLFDKETQICANDEKNKK